MKSIEYCARAVIRYLDGNIKLFIEYRDKAIKLYEIENTVPIGELIPDATKKKLYKIVN